MFCPQMLCIALDRQKNKIITWFSVFTVLFLSNSRVSNYGVNTVRVSLPDTECSGDSSLREACQPFDSASRGVFIRFRAILR